MPSRFSPLPTSQLWSTSEPYQPVRRINSFSFDIYFLMGNVWRSTNINPPPGFVGFGRWSELGEEERVQRTFIGKKSKYSFEIFHPTTLHHADDGPPPASPNHLPSLSTPQNFSLTPSHHTPPCQPTLQHFVNKILLSLLKMLIIQREKTGRGESNRLLIMFFLRGGVSEGLKNSSFLFFFFFLFFYDPWHV